MRRGLALLACLVEAAVTAGGAAADNGVASRSPDAILAAAVAAGQHARSVHVVGHAAQGGARLGLDLWLAGTSLRGRIVDQGVAFDLIVVGGKAYVKAGPAFWRKSAGSAGAAAKAAVALLANRWVEGSTRKGGIFAGITSGLELRQLLAAFRTSHGTLEKTAPSRVRGRPAIGLHDTTQGGTMYVATTGQPYPLSVQKSGKAGGLVEFEDWNAPLRIAAPAHAVDGDALAKLAHR